MPILFQKCCLHRTRYPVETFRSRVTYNRNPNQIIKTNKHYRALVVYHKLQRAPRACSQLCTSCFATERQAARNPTSNFPSFQRKRVEVHKPTRKCVDFKNRTHALLLHWPRDTGQQCLRFPDKSHINTTTTVLHSESLLDLGVVTSQLPNVGTEQLNKKASQPSGQYSYHAPA